MINSIIKYLYNNTNKKNNYDLCSLFMFINRIRNYEPGLIPIINYYCIPQKLIIIPNFKNELKIKQKEIVFSHNMRKKFIEITF